MPLIQGTATQARRFACDRCHSQKLRCPRPADGSDLNEPCVRCRKAGTSCNVSATLKTGRPSKALRLQARLGACSSTASPRPEQPPGLKTFSAPPQKENGNAPDEGGREETAEIFQFAASNHTSQLLSPSISASTTPTPTGFETTSTAMVMDDNSELLDLDMDFLDTLDANTTEQWFSTAEEMPGWNYMTEPNIPITRPNSADQLKFLRQDSTIGGLDGLLDLPLPDSPAHRNFALSDNNTMFESSTCSSPFPAYMTPGERASMYSVNQDTRKPDVAIQDFSQGVPNVTMTTEDERLAFGSLCPTLLYQDNPSHSKRCSQPTQGAFMTQGLSHGHPDKCQSQEYKHSQTILQLQIEIYDCSGRIIYPRRASESDDQQRQSRSEGLGKLFCTAEKFIKLIDQFCSGPRACSPPSTPSSLALSSAMKPSSTAVADAERKSYSDPPKPGVSSPALGPFGQEIPDTVPPSEPRFPDAATFHLIMACYTRLLTAYDVIIETIGAQLPSPSNFGGGPCSPIGASFSIGDFTVHSGTFLESLLHLQVISHQLGRLGDALYRYLLLSQPPRQAEDFSTASLRRPYKARRTGALTTMGDFAMEIVEEQEMALKMKIAKIRASARESQML